MLRLPDATAGGLSAVEAVLRARPDLTVAVGRLLDRAANIPGSSRRRVLAGLARLLPGVSSHARVRSSDFTPELSGRTEVAVPYRGNKTKSNLTETGYTFPSSQPIRSPSVTSRNSCRSRGCFRNFKIARRSACQTARDVIGWPLAVRMAATSLRERIACGL